MNEIVVVAENIFWLNFVAIIAKNGRDEIKAVTVEIYVSF